MLRIYCPITEEQSGLGLHCLITLSAPMSFIIHDHRPQLPPPIIYRGSSPPPLPATKYSIYNFLRFLCETESRSQMCQDKASNDNIYTFCFTCSQYWYACSFQFCSLFCYIITFSALMRNVVIWHLTLVLQGICSVKQKTRLCISLVYSCKLIKCTILSSLFDMRVYLFSIHIFD